MRFSEVAVNEYSLYKVNKLNAGERMVETEKLKFKSIEFISIGGLLPGITLADVYNGVSLLRNRPLADVFHRLHFIEKYGTGIRRIYAQYADSEVKPEISVAPNSFRITLPNVNKGSENTRQSGQTQVVIDYLVQHGSISETELQNLLNVKRTRAYTLAKQMVDAELIKVIGRGAGKSYVLYSVETEVPEPKCRQTIAPQGFGGIIDFQM